MLQPIVRPKRRKTLLYLNLVDSAIELLAIQIASSGITKLLTKPVLFCSESRLAGLGLQPEQGLMKNFLVKSAWYLLHPLEPNPRKLLRKAKSRLLELVSTSKVF